MLNSRTCLVCLLLICLPLARTLGQSDDIEATITVEGTAYECGGIIFDIVVKNNSNDTIVFYDSMDDSFAMLKCDSGQTYKSERNYFERILGDPITIHPGASYETRFETTSLGVSAYHFDYMGFGPTYAVGKYAVYDTLFYRRKGSRSSIQKMTVKTRLEIKKNTPEEEKLLTEYSSRYRGLITAMWGMLRENGNADKFIEQYKGQLSFADNCQGVRLQRRFYKAMLRFFDGNMRAEEIDYLHIENIENLRCVWRDTVQKYVTLYPGSPYGVHCIKKYVRLGGNLEFLNTFKETNPDSMLARVKGI
jgi:hypothetical protein